MRINLRRAELRRNLAGHASATPHMSLTHLGNSTFGHYLFAPFGATRSRTARRVPPPLRGPIFPPRGENGQKWPFLASRALRGPRRGGYRDPPRGAPEKIGRIIVRRRVFRPEKGSKMAILGVGVYIIYIALYFLLQKREVV